jgi:hypothetical protein
VNFRFDSGLLAWSVVEPLLEAHANPQAASRWVLMPHDTGCRVTAAGAPSRARLERWARNGVTDVVTLQRADEMASWLPSACSTLGIAWHHLPLSGRRLAGPSDMASVEKLGDLPELGTDRRIVLHCAAGMHRTGLCLYLLLRRAGAASDEALAMVEQARPVTAHELTKQTRRSGRLIDVAEGLLAKGRS